MFLQPANCKLTVNEVNGKKGLSIVTLGEIEKFELISADPKILEKVFFFDNKRTDINA